MDEKIVKDSQCLAKDLVNDCISRYGVSAWLDNMGYSKLADVVMDKDRFPSAQPEIIRCRDCKHCRRERSEESAKKFGQIYYCARNVFSCQTPDDFCSRAERREVSE